MFLFFHISPHLSLPCVGSLLVCFLIVFDRFSRLTTPYFIMPGADKKLKTLYDKVFEDHIVNEQHDGTILLYIGMLIPSPHFPKTPLLNMFPKQTDIWSTKSHLLYGARTCMKPAHQTNKHLASL
jgi:hypothetical protein